MASAAPMDRLIQLMLQTMQLDPNAPGRPSPEAIERGMTMLDAMLNSPEAAQVCGNTEGTFVILGMALEEKPMLQDVAVRCYEKAMDQMEGQPRGSWERCVVLQQLGTVCLRHNRAQEACKWLDQCAEESAKATGHPRDCDLFGGGFKTQQTRLQFQTMVAKLQTHLYSKLGDEAKARSAAAELERFAKLAQGDAVENAMAKSSTNGGSRAAAPSSDEELWKGSAEVKTLKEYRFADEGPTVLLILELNEHLDLGPEASTLVTSLEQFRVRCKEASLEIVLRLRRKGQIHEYSLNLDPLTHEVVPEDTVPRLRGKPDRRRLEVRLFKRDKAMPWSGELGKPTKSAASVPAKAVASASLLHPLSPEELAALPRPTTSGAGGENRPSTWRVQHCEQKSETQKACVETSSLESGHAIASTATAQSAEPDVSGVKELTAWPSWLSGLEHSGFNFDTKAKAAGTLTIILSDDAAIAGMQDLKLDASPERHRLKVQLQQHAGCMEFQVPRHFDVENLRARWRRKTLSLELRVPRIASC
mmetsp:Transcript_43842/g.80067  ORF Transcript_43842/g.80067 Transcript_43842/m.80067 type:complete len:532 (+) Transcript_43842:77-1672(+)